MKYNIGDFIFFISGNNKIVASGTITHVRKEQVTDFIYKVYHQKSGLTYEYPESHLKMFAKSSKEYEEKYGQQIQNW